MCVREHYTHIGTRKRTSCVWIHLSVHLCVRLSVCLPWCVSFASCMCLINSTVSHGEYLNIYPNPCPTKIATSFANEMFSSAFQCCTNKQFICIFWHTMKINFRLSYRCLRVLSAKIHQSLFHLDAGPHFGVGTKSYRQHQCYANDFHRDTQTALIKKE